jgi:hypothetical protein
MWILDFMLDLLVMRQAEFTINYYTRSLTVITLETFAGSPLVFFCRC